jgi:hypothetical protein
MMRGFTAFADCPNNKRLSPVNIAGREEFIPAAHKTLVGLDIPALVEINAERCKQPSLFRMNKPDGENNHIGVDAKFTARDFPHNRARRPPGPLKINLDTFNVFNHTLRSDKTFRQYRPLPLPAFFMARRRLEK